MSSYAMRQLLKPTVALFKPERYVSGRLASLGRVADWRQVLRRGPVVARQILRKIFPGVRLITLWPVSEGIAFTGAAPARAFSPPWRT